MTDNAKRVAGLIADLDQPDKPRIRAAVDALTALAAQSDELRGQLESLLRATDSLRWPIAYILGQLPQPSGTTIRTLIDTLDHREPDIRWAIALLLMRIAKSHGEVVGLLSGLASTGSTNQKRMAIYCLRDLNLQDPDSLHAMLQALRDVDATVRVAAVTSLKARGDARAVERGELLELFLRDDDLRVRNAAAITLAQWGAPSSAVVEALRAAAAGDHAQLRKAALIALAILDKQ